MRYFFQASYRGTNYAGWQRQPQDLSIQQVLEEAFSLILREEIQILGCGRTDSGVHAQQYYFHLDTEETFTPELLLRFNKYLPSDISLHTAYRVADGANARYDAVRRTYQYYLRFRKDALAGELSVWYPYFGQLDQNAMQDIAALLMKYEEFKPFCKEGSDAKHYLCKVFASQWTFTDREAIFTISANRFLRGMVRLIVGACIQAGRGIVSTDDIKSSLERQSSLPKAESAPAHGLHLVGVEYPPGLLKENERIG